MSEAYLYEHGRCADQQSRTTRLELHWTPETGAVVLGSTHWQGDPDQVDRSATDLPGDRPAWAGPLLELTRSDIDYLIARLQTARDQVYGPEK